MQLEEKDIRFVYEENTQFIDEKIDAPINRQEILAHLSTLLENKKVFDFRFVFVVLFLGLIWIILILPTIGLFVTLFSMLDVLISEQAFFEEYRPSSLLYIGLVCIVWIAGGIMFGKPLFKVTTAMFSLPYHYSSAERLFSAMLKNRNIIEGRVFRVDANENHRTISYSFVQANKVTEGSLMTRHGKNLKVSDKIYVVAAYKVSFPL